MKDMENQKLHIPYPELHSLNVTYSIDLKGYSIENYFQKYIDVLEDQISSVSSRYWELYTEQRASEYYDAIDQSRIYEFIESSWDKEFMERTRGRVIYNLIYNLHKLLSNPSVNQIHNLSIVHSPSTEPLERKRFRFTDELFLKVLADNSVYIIKWLRELISCAIKENLNHSEILTFLTHLEKLSNEKQATTT